MENKRRNIKLVIAYDGSKYNGWQKQGNTGNTIQEKLEVLLGKMTNEEVEIHGSGRTDAGVHAKGQVANFHTNCKMSCQDMLSYINEYLPKDISVLSVEEVEERFHSRLWAEKKTYEYHIVNSQISDVFARKYSVQVIEYLDIEKMRDAAKLLIGTHDFIGFSSNKRMKKSTVRTIYQIDITNEKDKICISYCGNGFLYNMVRIMTGTLIEIGLGKRDIKSIEDILENRNRMQAGYTAPAQGLFLASVEYKEK